MDTRRFNLTIDNRADGTGRNGHGQAFLRAGGRDLVEELMRHSGLADGEWTLRLVDSLPSHSGNSPRIQVRRPDDYGVQLHLKPGDNGTAIKAVLQVARAGPYSVQEVFQRLTNGLVVMETRPTANCTKEDLGRRTIATIATSLASSAAEDPRKLGPLDSAHLPRDEQQARAQQNVAVAEPPPPATGAAAILARRNTLEALAKLPEKLQHLAEQRAECERKIALVREDAARKTEQLELALQRYEAEEKKLLAGIDIEAIDLLVGSIT